ncbi:MAG: DUF1456 family protein [Saccharospirillaceae bacterium]|nr:DUF1456 family protein [Saccharospirillaceae bacterium]
MTNNDILRRLRYSFNLNDTEMTAIFSLGDCKASQEQITGWLKKEELEGYIRCDDDSMNAFLDGFIIEKRGPREEPEAADKSAKNTKSAVDPWNKAHARINNNIILRKLKIALNLRSEDILKLLALAGFKLGKSELSAFFRNPGHRHYRECQDQVLRNFLQGVQKKYRS